MQAAEETTTLASDEIKIKSPSIARSPEQTRAALQAAAKAGSSRALQKLAAMDAGEPAE